MRFMCVCVRGRVVLVYENNSRGQAKNKVTRYHGPMEVETKRQGRLENPPATAGGEPLGAWQNAPPAAAPASQAKAEGLPGLDDARLHAVPYHVPACEWSDTRVSGGAGDVEACPLPRGRSSTLLCETNLASCVPSVFTARDDQFRKSAICNPTGRSRRRPYFLAVRGEARAGKHTHTHSHTVRRT